MKVLVVDDDPSTLEIVTATLERFGYEVATASDGASAWQQFHKDAYSVVITDWEMAGLDGIELCRKIRQADVPNYIYIIFLTSRQERQYVIECLSAGADDFISKPFNPEELRVRLRAAERILNLEHNLRKVNHELRHMNKRLLKMSRLDPLMEIGNRLAFEETVASFHEQAVERNVPYGVVMADVDHFKSCNDSFGHQRGDRVLRELAAAIRARLRAHDAAFRYGGEEILILLNHQDLQGAVAAAERIRQSIEQLELRLGPAGELLRVTVSCGVACYPAVYDPATGWQGLVGVADRALYEAKAAGRNCVVAACPSEKGIRFVPAAEFTTRREPEPTRAGQDRPVPTS